MQICKAELRLPFAQTGGSCCLQHALFLEIVPVDGTGMAKAFSERQKRQLRKLTILRVVSPCSFWVKYGPKQDKENIDFMVDCHYKTHNVGQMGLHNLKKNLNVVVYVQKKSVWCRAQVLGFDKRTYEKLVVVRLLDRGCKESVSIDNIRVGHQHFFQVPPLAFQLFIPGLRPFTLQVMLDASATETKARAWDTSAKELVTDLAFKYPVSVEIFARNKEADLMGNVILHQPDGDLDLMRTLVDRKYAVFEKEDFELDMMNFQLDNDKKLPSNLVVGNLRFGPPQMSIEEKMANWDAESMTTDVYAPPSSRIPPVLAIPNVYEAVSNPKKVTDTGQQKSKPTSQVHKLKSVQPAENPPSESKPNFYPAGMNLGNITRFAGIPEPTPTELARNDKGPSVKVETRGAELPMSIPKMSTAHIRDPAKLRRDREEIHVQTSVSSKPEYLSRSASNEEEDEDDREYALQYRKIFGKQAKVPKTQMSEAVSLDRHFRIGASGCPVEREESGVREQWSPGSPTNGHSSGSCSFHSFSSDPDSSRSERDYPSLDPHHVALVQNKEPQTCEPEMESREGRAVLMNPRGALEVRIVKPEKQTSDVATIPRLSAVDGGVEKEQLQAQNKAVANSADVVKNSRARHSLRLQKDPFGYARCPPSEFGNAKGIEDRMMAAKILICGDKPPERFTCLEGLTCPLISKNLVKLNVLWPNTMQSHVWPAIMAKRNVVTICAKATGKTIAYLAPVLVDLVNKKQSEPEETSSSPTVVVLASSWQQAMKIYSQGCTLVQGCDTFRTAMLHGGGAEETQKVVVINGCDLLVSTPSALMRLLESTKANMFSLAQLRYLIFDDLNGLIDNYTTEIEYILRNFLSALKGVPNTLTIRRQILAFGNYWTPSFRAFVESTIPKHLFYCTSLYEAAIYSSLNIITHSVQCPDKLAFFLDTFLPQLKTGGEKTVIFTTEVCDAIAIYNCLNEYCRVLLAHHQMDISTLADISRCWYNRVAILVVTDTCWNELAITDATFLLHYDVPKLAKGIFANRFGCLLEQMSFFGAFSKLREESSSANCKVHLLITNECKTQAHALYLLLARLVATIPPMLEKLLVKYYKDREYGKCEVPLCDSIKAFGRCYNKSRCTQRHIVIMPNDNPTLGVGTGSKVKVEITHIRNATHFYGRVIEFTDHSGNIVKRPSVDIFFLEKLKICMKPESRIRFEGTPIIGEMLAYAPTDGNIHRVLIKELGEGAHVEVIHVDSGDKLKIQSEDLLQLPAELKSVPPLVHEIFACSLRPIDKDQEWTANACKRVFDLMTGATITGKAVVALGNTLWVNPIENRVYLRCVKTEVSKWNLEKELLGSYAERNDSHIADVLKLCEIIPNANLTCRQQETTVLVSLAENQEGPLAMRNQWVRLGEGPVDVVVSSVQNPSKFFVLKRERKQRLDELIKDIGEDYTNSRNCVQHVTLEKDAMYMARCPSDEQWHRVKLLDILSANKDGELEVNILYVDVGLECAVKADVLRHLTTSFVHRLPFQAVECSLDSIIPCGDGDWNCESSAKFWDITKDENGSAKVLTAKVITKRTASTAEEFDMYTVELFDGDISLNKVLCDLGYAKKKQAENVEIKKVEKTLKNSLLELQKLQMNAQSTETIPEKPAEVVKPIAFKQESVQPRIVWSDTKEQLKITVLVSGVKNYTLTVNEQFINFRSVVDNVVNVSYLVTYDKVECNKEHVQVKDNSVVITLRKLNAKTWPRLLQDAKKHSWIQFDFNAISDEMSDDDELRDHYLPVPKGYNTEVLDDSDVSDDAANHKDDVCSDEEADDLLRI